MFVISELVFLFCSYLLLQVFMGHFYIIECSISIISHDSYATHDDPEAGMLTFSL